MEVIEASTFVIIEKTIHEFVSEMKKFEVKIKEVKKNKGLQGEPDIFL